MKLVANSATCYKEQDSTNMGLQALHEVPKKLQWKLADVV